MSKLEEAQAALVAAHTRYNDRRDELLEVSSESEAIRDLDDLAEVRSLAEFAVIEAITKPYAEALSALVLGGPRAMRDRLYLASKRP